MAGTDNKAELVCESEDCEEKGATHCKTCSHTFCVTHDKAHSELLKIVKTPHHVITILEYKRVLREENSRYCSQHEKSTVVMACEHCYKPLCPDCVDEGTVNKTLMKCDSSESDEHRTRTIRQVSNKIQEELSDILSKLRIKEMSVSDCMKERHQLYDKQMEDRRTDLQKLEAKVEELHKLIDTCYKEWKETLVNHMTSKREMMEKLEAEFDLYRNECQNIHDRASEYKNQSDELIVKDQWDVKSKLEPLMNFQLQDNPNQFTKLTLTITDAPITFPVSFKTVEPKLPLFQKTPTVRVPTSLQFKEEINTPSGKNAHCVLYSKAGKLLHAGDYQPRGLAFTPHLPNHENMSLYEHRSSLYIIQYFNSNCHIHVINLNNQSVSQSIISFSVSGVVGCSQHLTVNDEYIISAIYCSHTIKVYSTVNHNHLLDIKDSSIFKSPLGLAFLGEDLLVGNCCSGQLVNMTVSATPEIRWTCTGVTYPSSIKVVEDSQIIMVGCAQKREICIVSYQGEKLSTLGIPQCSIYNNHISVYNNQLAVSDQLSKIKVYEIKYET